MPTYAILGIDKQKGSQITLSGRHNDRTQPVPNADPERTHLTASSPETTAPPARS